MSERPTGGAHDHIPDEDDEEFCPDCALGLDSASHYDCPNGPWSSNYSAGFGTTRRDR